MIHFCFEVIEYTTEGWGRSGKEFNSLEEARRWISEDQKERDPALEINYSVVPSGPPIFQTDFQYN